MKIIHIESGLGNQMLSYCEYLAIKQSNPEEKIYIETIVYDIPEANGVICQWNGYELNSVFGIDAPNVKELFTAEQWENIIREVRESKFWERNWNYPVVITEAFRKHGLDVVNGRGDFESPGWPLMVVPREKSLKRKIKDKLEHFLPYIYLRQYWQRKQSMGVMHDYTKELFVTSDENLFTGQKLLFKQKNSGMERIESMVRECFAFPPITDDKNRDMMAYIQSCNAVAIHARRGDMLGYNYAFYVTGFFKRAVKYIRKHTENPVFFIFCDPGSVEWARNNADVLGLDFDHDEIHFVDWNKASDSYRDMQLMAACKHQVITNSSFGWWGAWLNENPDKITCSPEYAINTTHFF